MSPLLIPILLAIPGYFLPGFLVFEMLDVRNLTGWDRFFFSLCTSLILVPTAFILVGNVFHFIPGPLSYLILIVGLLGLGLVFRLFHIRPVIRFPVASPVSTIEKIAAWSAIFLFAAVANLSRLAMFVQGAQTVDLGTYDESWHLAELVSVARTGIPPMHYFFPGISLVYYYSSWIYPAILGNLPVFHISLARAMALHAFIQIFAFLGLVYYFLVYNFKNWWVRLIGISFFTIMAGFGLFANAPSIIGPESWQSQARWLSASIPIIPFTSQYAWVPQDIAGAMAFLFGLLIWKNIKASLPICSVITGILLAFSFTSAFFVFLSSALVMVMVLLVHRRLLQANWKVTLRTLVLIGTMFLLISWRSLLSYAGHGSGFAWSSFRILTIELLRGGSRFSVWMDRALTVVGFPFIMAWIGVISIGLPFLLYLLWLGRVFSRSGRTGLDADSLVIALFPPFYMLLNVLFTDVNGGGGFAMRGLIPALMLINFGASVYLDSSPTPFILSPRIKWISIYLFACFFIAEGLSAYAQIRWASVDSVKSVIELNLRPLWKANRQTGGGTSLILPGRMAYITWLNLHTPTNALIIEDGCPSDMGDQLPFHWLERVRFLDPACTSFAQFFGHDIELVSYSALGSLLNQEKNYPSLIAFYQSTIPPDAFRAVYYVDRSQPVDPAWGSPVYADSFVQVYRLK